MIGNLIKTDSISILAKECRKLGEQNPPPTRLPSGSFCWKDVSMKSLKNYK